MTDMPVDVRGGRFVLKKVVLVCDPVQISMNCNYVIVSLWFSNHSVRAVVFR